MGWLTMATPQMVPDWSTTANSEPGTEMHFPVVPVELPDECVGAFHANWFQGKGLVWDDIVDGIGQR
jgi:hypothetical protein